MTMNNTSVNQLIAEGAKTKAQLKMLQDKLRQINAALAGVAVFPDGKNTAHLAGNGYAVKIQRRENVKWNQDKLENCRRAMGNDEFFNVFTWEFKPASAKALDGFMKYGDQHFSALINDARTVTPGAPQVTYQTIEG